MKFEQIGLIGYGEVGRIFAAGIKAQAGVSAVGAWDLQFANPEGHAAVAPHAAQAGVKLHDSCKALCDASELVISAVTASNTLAVAEEAAQHLRLGAVFLDFNSASPGTKQRCAALVEVRGAGCALCRGGRNDVRTTAWHQDADAARWAASRCAGLASH